MKSGWGKGGGLGVNKRSSINSHTQDAKLVSGSEATHHHVIYIQQKQPNTLVNLGTSTM